MNVVSSHRESGALCHLVEAATALAKLSDLDESPGLPCNEATSKPALVVAEDDDLRQPSKSSHRSSSAKREIFPQRLFAILNDSSLSDVVTWLPHGRSFVILRPDVFTEKVLPMYLPPVESRGSTKYPSFTRKLNRWGFRQATKGPDTGAFHHPLFRRDQPNLCLDMVCQRSRDRKASSSTSSTSSTLATSSNTKKDTKKIFKDKLKVAPLTKESLDAIASSEPPTFAPPASVTDESRSVGSSAESVGANPQTVSYPLPPGISNDSIFVETTLQKRDQMERMKVAKAMLYVSYLKALNGDRDINSLSKNVTVP